jgi:hypothetical protein
MKIKRFNENNSETLKVTASDLNIFADKGTNPNYPNLEYYSDTHEGEFDSEKGAMYDYPIYLNDIKTHETIWEGEGGYYTGPTGEVHNYAITFTKYQKKKTVKESSIDLARKIMDACKIDVDEVDIEQIEYVSELIIDWYNRNSK